MKNILFVILVLFSIIITNNAKSSSNVDTILVDFHGGWLYYRDNRFPVVLPKNQFPLPVTGIVTRLDRYPTWYPTPNTRASMPGLPKVVPYGHRLNAMGEGRIVMDFNESWMRNTALQFVRIHGNANPHELHQRKSRGCIRMLDSDIILLMEMIKNQKPLIFFY